MNTVIAFRYFQQRQVDVGLIEVGMGGRLDSTNVITPEACAITNIDLEHTQFLGDTLPAIAYEKAGILKPHVPAIIGDSTPEVLAVIRKQANKVNAPLRCLGEAFNYTIEGPAWQQQFSYESDRLQLRNISLGLAGPYQGANAAVAVALAESLLERFPNLTAETIQHGLIHARWPGRLERVLDEPPVIIDVAHNVAGAQQLRTALERCITILAVSSDKDALGMLRQLAPITDTLILTAFQGKRATSVEHLAGIASDENIPCQTAASIREAIQMALPLANADTPLLITGSIYTAGEARDILTEDYGATRLAF